jgi:hypothetical protein
MGRGPQPYVQFPWSWEVAAGWSVSGMFTAFFHPSDGVRKQVYQFTFVVERKVGEKAAVFIEWVGASDEPARHLLNSGPVFPVED